MGKKQYRVIYIWMGILSVQLLIFSCVLKKNISIASFSIEKDAIRINLDCRNFSQKITEVIIENNDDYYVFEDDDICNIITDRQAEIILDCSCKTLKTNKKYKVSLRFSGGFTSATVFLENSVETGGTFPCEDFEHIQILILDKSTLIGI